MTTLLIAQVAVAATVWTGAIYIAVTGSPLTLNLPKWKRR